MPERCLNFCYLEPGTGLRESIYTEFSDIEVSICDFF